MIKRILAAGVAFYMAKKVMKDNFGLEISEYTIKDELINQPLRVVCISDTHIPYSNIRLEKLINIVKQEKPDLILIAGDLLDRLAQREDISRAQWFITMLSHLALVAITQGNHEIYLKDFPLLKDCLMINGSREVMINNQVIEITNTKPKENLFSIVLNHYPERASNLLVQDHSYQFSGHIHGGQFIINGKGLLSPEIEWYPKYFKGYYNFGPSRGLFVSAGLGSTIIPIRINNPNHLIIVNFENKV